MADGTPCPHCAVPITHLSGFMPQATLETRLGDARTAHQRALTLVQTDLVDARAQAADYTTIKTERDTLLSEKTNRLTRDTRIEGMRVAGVDPAHLARFVTIYDSDQVGQAEPKAWDAWLADSKGDGFLGHFYGDPAAIPTTTPTTTNGAPTTTMHVLAALTADPAVPGDQRFTKEDVEAYWKSPEYLAKTPTEKQADNTRLQAITKTWEQPDSRSTGRF